MGEQVVSTGLSPRYQDAWGAVEALRELIQEAMDAKAKFGCRVRISWIRGRAVIEDDGPGFDRSALALGNSGKRGDGSMIGQFGEGMKLALLVLARSGREALAETAGFSVAPFLARDPALGCETLHLSVKENCRVRGTRFEVQASEEELAQACKFFLALDPDRPRPVSPRYPVVMMPGGRVYVNGVLAAEQPDLAFSYALSGEAAKALQNRDRSVVAAGGLRKALSSVWDLAPASVLEALFRTVGKGACFEHGVGFSPISRAARAAAVRVWGPRAAQIDADDPLANSYLASLGFVLVDDLPWVWRLSLSACGALPYASKAAGQVRQRSRRVLRQRDLTEEERSNLKFAVKVVGRHVAPPGRLVLVDQLFLGGGPVLGTCDMRSGKITISRKALQTQSTAVAVVTHEVLHRVSGAGDCSRGFQEAWQNLATKLLLHIEGVS